MKGSPPFQPGDALALAGEVEQQLIDFLLGYCVIGTPLAHIDAFRVAPRHIENFRGYQAVVQHNVCLLQQSLGLEGHECPGRRGLRRSGRPLPACLHPGSG